MNAVHFSSVRGGRVTCVGILFYFVSRVFAADLTIWAEGKPALVFAGENKSVRLFIKNSSNSLRKIKIDTRTFEVFPKTAEPLGDRKKWKELSLEAGQTSVEKFPLALPTIKEATTFVLKFYEQDNVVEIGSVPLLVYPEDLLADFRQGQKGLLSLSENK